jgi:hypothetical protein
VSTKLVDEPNLRRRTTTKKFLHTLANEEMNVYVCVYVNVHGNDFKSIYFPLLRILTSCYEHRAEAAAQLGVMKNYVKNNFLDCLISIFFH